MKKIVNYTLAVFIIIGLLLIIQDYIYDYGLEKYCEGYVIGNSHDCNQCAELAKESNELRRQLWNCRQGVKK